MPGSGWGRGWGGGSRTHLSIRKYADVIACGGVFNYTLAAGLVHISLRGKGGVRCRKPVVKRGGGGVERHEHAIKGPACRRARTTRTRGRTQQHRHT